MFKKIILLLNYIVGYQFLYMVIIYLISQSEDWALYLSVIITFVVNLLLFYPQLKQDCKDQKIKEIAKNALKTAAMMYAVLIAISVGLSLLGIPTDSANQQLIEELFKNPQYKYFMISTIVIFAPIVEEAVFRYGIRALLPKKLSNGLLFIILSAVSFGFVHIFSDWLDNGLLDVVNLVIYSALGLMLALNYKKNDFNIIYPLTVHLLYNGVQICLMMMIL